MRDKLIELLDRAHHNASAATAGDEGDYFSGLETEADYLLAHGVTVQEWISVKDRLPDELPKDGSAWSERVRPSVDVLVKMKGLKELYTAWYSYSRKEWIDTSETHNLGDSVIYWMPLPEPPKEEA